MLILTVSSSNEEDKFDVQLVKRADSDDAFWDRQRDRRMIQRLISNNRNGVANTPGRMIAKAAVDLAGEVTARVLWPCLRPYAENCWEMTSDGARCAYDACENCVQQSAEDLANAARAGARAASSRVSRVAAVGRQGAGRQYVGRDVGERYDRDNEMQHYNHERPDTISLDEDYPAYSEDYRDEASIATSSPMRQRMNRQVPRRH